MEHTKEPWNFITWADTSSGIYDENNIRILTTDYELNEEADARRIVACVNAFEGYTQEQVELIAHNGGVSTFSLETVKAMESDRDKWKALAVELGHCLREEGDFLEHKTLSLSDKSDEALAKLKEMES